MLPVVDSGGGMWYARTAGCGSLRGVFPSVVFRPKMVDIMAGMTRGGEMVVVIPVVPQRLITMVLLTLPQLQFLDDVPGMQVV